MKVIFFIFKEESTDEHCDHLILAKGQSQFVTYMPLLGLISTIDDGVRIAMVHIIAMRPLSQFPCIHFSRTFDMGDCYLAAPGVRSTVV